MQTCYNCGKQVSDETLICPDCGALVRRYTTPVNPAVNPAPVQSVPAVPGAVPPPAGGKLRLRGAVKVWLIIECVLCGYMAFSALCAGLLAGNPQAMEMMAKKQELDAFVQKTGHSREEVIRTRKWFSDFLNNGKYEYHETLVPQPNQPRYTITMKNESGYDFRRFSCAATPVHSSGSSQTYTCTVENWKNNTMGVLKIDCPIPCVSWFDIEVDDIDFVVAFVCQGKSDNVRGTVLFT